MRSETGKKRTSAFSEAEEFRRFHSNGRWDRDAPTAAVVVARFLLYNWGAWSVRVLSVLVPLMLTIAGPCFMLRHRGRICGRIASAPGLGWRYSSDFTVAIVVSILVRERRVPRIVLLRGRARWPGVGAKVASHCLAAQFAKTLRHGHLRRWAVSAFVVSWP